MQRGYINLAPSCGTWDQSVHPGVSFGRHAKAGDGLGQGKFFSEGVAQRELGNLLSMFLYISGFIQYIQDRLLGTVRFSF